MLDLAIPSATRAEGLRRLEALRPRIGRAYAAGRNHDFGPGDRSNVSVLSPWTRRRLVLEEELVETAIGARPCGRQEVRSGGSLGHILQGRA
jgi:deoxyribodipyrimidine photo-lyase